MRMRQLAVLILLAFAAAASAQEPPAQTFNDSVSVGYVMIPFTVLGRNGAPITNLKQRDVALLSTASASAATCSKSR